MHLTGKIIFITGSTRGIGRSLAEHCLRYGAHVIAHGRTDRGVQDVCKQLSAISPHIDGVRADISFVSQRVDLINHLKKNYGKIDIFVHNAAVSMRGHFADCTDRLLNTMIATNVTAPVLLVRSIIPLLSEGGTIMFVSSAAGLYGFPSVIPYSVTKMCLTALQQGLNIELHERKIHVGTVYLDFVENDSKKTILNARNQHITLQRRARLTQQDAAHAILAAIMHRHRTRYVGFGTKAVAVLARYFPHLFHRLLIMRKHTIHEGSDAKE